MNSINTTNTYYDVNKWLTGPKVIAGISAVATAAYSVISSYQQTADSPLDSYTSLFKTAVCTTGAALATYGAARLIMKPTFEQGLDNWCDEKKGQPEYYKRLLAAKRIKNCYHNKSDSLNLKNLGLTTLPREIGNLTALTSLDLWSNQLSTYPPSLLELSSGCTLDLSSNRFSAQTVQRLQQEIAAARSQNHLLGPELDISIYDPSSNNTQLTFEQTLEGWAKEINEAYPEVDISCFETFQKIVDGSDTDKLKAFLQRLRSTEDYKNSHTKKSFINQVFQMIEGASSNDDFYKMLEPIIDEALTSCHDRIAYYFDQINLQHKQYVLKLNDFDFAHLLIGLKRLDLVADFAKKKEKEKNLGDFIETLLLCQVKMKEALNLPLETKGMLYAAVGGLSDEEITSGIKEIEQATADPTSILLANEAWIQRMEKSERVKIEKINEKYSELIDKILFPESSLASSNDTQNLEKYTNAQKEEIAALLKGATEKILSSRQAAGESKSDS